MIAIIIIVVVILMFLWGIGTYNGLVKAKLLVEEAFATMDVYLKKRYDMIPNLVETVKGYASHEKETLEQIVQMRSGKYEEMSPGEKIQIDRESTQKIAQIMAVAEAYPELKANENFLEFSKEVRDMEGEIANARKYYNGSVRQYNMKVQMFPGSLIAGMLGFAPKEMYQVEEAAERKNVQVKF